MQSVWPRRLNTLHMQALTVYNVHVGLHVYTRTHALTCFVPALGESFTRTTDPIQYNTSYAICSLFVLPSDPTKPSSELRPVKQVWCASRSHTDNKMTEVPEGILNQLEPIPAWYGFCVVFVAMFIFEMLNRIVASYHGQPGNERSWQQRNLLLSWMHTLIIAPWDLSWLVIL